MKAAIQLPAQTGGGFQRFVAQREGSVQAEKRPKAWIVRLVAVADELHVFLQPLPGFFGAVPVGDLVAQAGADPGPLDRRGDVLQRLHDGAGAGMVVENGGHPMTDSVDQQEQGAVIAVLGGQGLIQPPP